MTTIDLIRMQTFVVAPDESLAFSVKDLILSAPFFRLCEESGHWIDATGDYDLEVDQAGTTFVFTSRRSFTATYGYRYFSVAWIAKRLGL